MKNALTFAAVAEAATGLALLIAPSLVVQLLLGEQLTGVAIPVARVAGVVLIGLIIVSSSLRVALESYLTSILETELDADAAALAVEMDASLTHFVGPRRRSCPSLFESIEAYQRFRARRLCLVRVKLRRTQAEHMFFVVHPTTDTVLNPQLGQ